MIDSPSVGSVRLDLALMDWHREGRARYEGALHFASSSCKIACQLDGASITVQVEGPRPDTAGLQKFVASLVRAATKAAITEGIRPPNRISRWRVFAEPSAVPASSSDEQGS